MPLPNTRFTHVRDYLVSVQHEGMKLWRVFDASNRVIIQYECPAKTLDGEQCLKTQYSYNGTTNDVRAQKESLDVWSGAWDVLT